MDKHQHRFLLLARLRLGPHIQSQTVLADGNARVGHGLDNRAANVRDAVVVDQRLREIGVVRADVGGDACRALVHSHTQLA